jgi:flagellar hook-basal body complex protein FliE
MVDINSLTAVNAYRNQLKMLKDTDGSGATDDSAKPSFSNMVEGALKDSLDSAYKSEAAQVGSLTGKVELSDLVTAVANADLTLNTVVAVRDRVISAYEDIIKMPI